MFIINKVIVYITHIRVSILLTNRNHVFPRYASEALLLVDFFIHVIRFNCFVVSWTVTTKLGHTIPNYLLSSNYLQGYNDINAFIE